MVEPKTMSPTLYRGVFDSITTPVPLERMTAPISIGGRYPGASFIHVRIVGSIESIATLISASPSLQTGICASINFVVDAVIIPVGRSASVT